MSDLFVDNIKHQSSQGSGTITLGASGEKITTATGAEFSAITGQNYPAFYAYRNANQSITSATNTKVQINTEVFDTGSYFDNSTNYRYTPLVAGKYFFFGSARGDAGSNNLNNMAVQIKKNGSDTGMIAQYNNAAPNRFDNMSINVSGFFDMNGTDDYVELYVTISDSSGNPNIIGNSTQKYTVLGAYRVGA